MKTISFRHLCRSFSKAVFILLAVGGLSSCESDRSSNPVLSTPQDFTLNTPSYAQLPVDLATTDSMMLSWSQPQYTSDFAPLPLTYEIQISLTDQFTVSLDSADNDISGVLKADYAALPRTTTYCRYHLIAADLNYLLMRLGNYPTEADMPKQLSVYIRVNAFIQENLRRLNEHPSNSIAITSLPFYEKIEYLDPILWYMVGDCIGSKAWGNDGAQAIGTGIIPTFYIAGEKYNKVTGTGLTTFSCYLPAGHKFRMLLTPGVWDNDHGFKQLAEDKDNPMKYYNTFEGGDDNNIVIKQSGYYTLTVNTANTTISIDPFKNEDGTTEVKTYNKLTANGKQLTAVFTLDDQINHCWSMTVKGGDTFKVTATDGTEWGYKKGLQGSGDANGSLVIPDGTYLFLFNDLTGDYMLIEK